MTDPAPHLLGPAYPERAAWGTAPRLRAWQDAALRQYLEAGARDFLAVATPGSGKTTFALTVASVLLERRVIDRVTIVAPTEHLKTQWAQAAARAGLAVDPSYSPTQGRPSKDYVGVAVTYAGVAAKPLAFRVRTERYRTLVILDEVHHAGDALSWGEAVQEAFEPATRRLALTGTPFRSDVNPIPFVMYSPDAEGVRRSVADYTYGYAEALADRVVRPVLFMAYSGDVQWRSRAGDEMSARLGQPLTRDQAAQALRTALHVDGAWVPAVLAAADRRLTEVRQHVPDAAGLVIATDQEAARGYAKLVADVTGKRPTLVLSDERAASQKIADFAASDSRWMVAVRMVSEGVDIPRFAVGVYATTAATPLYFAQAVGRFVRARRRGETATVFVPSVGPLLALAAEMEVQRDHALRRPVSSDEDIFAAEDDLVSRANADPTVPEVGPGYAALSSAASFDRVVFDGGEFGPEGDVTPGSDEELDFLGIPGLLEPDQVRHLLRARQNASSRQRHRSGGASPPEPATHERLAGLRKELNTLVAAWHHRSGSPHGVIHSELRKACGGPPAAAATASELEQRISTIRSWAANRRRD